MIRNAEEKDLSRIAEIFVFNNRINYYPIFNSPEYSFGEMQVVSLIDHYFRKEEILSRIYVFDDGLVKGFIQLNGSEICKLYVEPFFQKKGIGHQLIEFAVQEMGANYLWALEKNGRAISFYNRHGFRLSGKRTYEEGTTEFLVELVRHSE